MSLAILRNKEVETVAAFVKLFSASLEVCSGVFGNRPYVIVSGLNFMTWRKVVPVVELFCVFSIPEDADMTLDARIENNKGCGSPRGISVFSALHQKAYKICSEELQKILKCGRKALPEEICGTVVLETSASLMVMFHFRMCKSSSIAIALTPVITGSEFPEDINSVLLLQRPHQLEWDDTGPERHWYLIPPPFNHKSIAYSWDIAYPSAYESIADFKKLVSPKLLLAYLAELHKWNKSVECPMTAIWASAKAVDNEEICFTYKKNSLIFRQSTLSLQEGMSLTVLNAKEIETVFTFMKLLNSSLDNANGIWCEQPYTTVAGLRFQHYKNVMPVVELFYILNRPYQDGTYKIVPSKEDLGYFNYFRTTVKCGLKPATFRKKAEKVMIVSIKNIIDNKCRHLPSEVARMELLDTAPFLVITFRFRGCVMPSVAVALTPAIAGTGQPEGTNPKLKAFFKHGSNRGSPRYWWYLIPPPTNHRLNNTSWEMVIPSLSDLVKDSNKLISAIIFLQYIAEEHQWSRFGLQSSPRAILSLVLWLEPDLMFLLSNSPLQEQMAVLMEQLVEALTTGSLPDFVVPTFNYLSGATEIQRTRLAVELKKGFVSLTSMDNILGTFVENSVSTAQTSPKLSNHSLFTVNTGQQTDRTVDDSENRTVDDSENCTVYDSETSEERNFASESDTSVTDNDLELSEERVVQKVAVCNNYHVSFTNKSTEDTTSVADLKKKTSQSKLKKAFLTRSVTLVLTVVVVIMALGFGAALGVYIDDLNAQPNQDICVDEDDDSCSDDDYVSIH